ncbi:HNH endonuclease [Luteolibacter algae]|uniref:HNH endonuclease n=1 Tax=Luteolibacter algae TaxID=454151 RepID=A0ABW5D283_9BACT
MSAPLELPVLVLNRYWQPVHTCSARRAVHLLCIGHAHVVQVDGEEKFTTHDLGSWIGHSKGIVSEEMIHSVRLALLVPKIIVLSIYDSLPRLELKFTRRNVFLRDKFTCQYCLKVLPENKLNLDHVIPRDKGGKTTWENIVASCVKCNTRKANKFPQEANMYPANKPFAPRWRPLYGLQENGLGDESWAHFLHFGKKESRKTA